MCQISLGILKSLCRRLDPEEIQVIALTFRSPDRTKRCLWNLIEAIGVCLTHLNMFIQQGLADVEEQVMSKLVSDDVAGAGDSAACLVRHFVNPP